jgi:Spy/CpxP family protein refolding chaperone
MKKILSAALAIVLFAGAANAQISDNSDRRYKGEKKEAMADRLNLTPEQKIKFNAIRDAHKAEMKSLRENANATPEQRKAVHEKYKAQYKEILTPAQQAEWDKKKGHKDRGTKGNAMGHMGGGMGAQAAFYKKELNITSDQETKLTSIYQEFRTKAQGIRSNNNLSQEQKKNQMQILSQQYMAQGKSVLTPEQARKFEEMKSKRWNRKNSNV